MKVNIQAFTSFSPYMYLSAFAFYESCFDGLSGFKPIEHDYDDLGTGLVMNAINDMKSKHANITYIQFIMFRLKIFMFCVSTS